MKRLIFIFAFLIVCSAIQANARGIMTMCGAGVPVAGCGASSEPAGDIFSDGFETATTGYELSGWTEVGTVDPAYSLTGLSAPEESCNQGIQTASTGSMAYIKRDLGTGVTTYWGQFSLYIRSHSLGNYATVTIAVAGNNDFTPAAGAGVLIKLYKPTGDTLRIYAQGASDSSMLDVASTTWHTVNYCVTDGSIGSDPCGAGTNGYGWISLNGGTSKTTFPSVDIDEGSHRYFHYGVLTASRTLDILFGYVATDDDGSF